MLLSRASPAIAQVEAHACSARVRQQVFPPLEGHEAKGFGRARKNLPSCRCLPLHGNTRTAYSVACSSAASAELYSSRRIGVSAPPRPAAVPSRTGREPSCRAAPPSAPRPALQERLRTYCRIFCGPPRRPPHPRDRPAPCHAPTTAALSAVGGHGRPRPHRDPSRAARPWVSPARPGVLAADGAATVPGGRSPWPRPVVSTPDWRRPPPRDAIRVDCTEAVHPRPQGGCDPPLSPTPAARRPRRGLVHRRVGPVAAWPCPRPPSASRPRRPAPSAAQSLSSEFVRGMASSPAPHGAVWSPRQSPRHPSAGRLDVNGLRNCGEGEKGVEVARQVASRSRAVGIGYRTYGSGFARAWGVKKGRRNFGFSIP
jgi:hypothetical protein